MYSRVLAAIALRRRVGHLLDDLQAAGAILQPRPRGGGALPPLLQGPDAPILGRDVSSEVDSYGYALLPPFSPREALDLEVVRHQIALAVPEGDEPEHARERPDARDLLGPRARRHEHGPAAGVARLEVPPTHRPARRRAKKLGPQRRRRGAGPRAPPRPRQAHAGRRRAPRAGSAAPSRGRRRRCAGRPRSAGAAPGRARARGTCTSAAPRAGSWAAPRGRAPRRPCRRASGASRRARRSPRPERASTTIALRVARGGTAAATCREAASWDRQAVTLAGSRRRDGCPKGASARGLTRCWCPTEAGAAAGSRGRRRRG